MKAILILYNNASGGRDKTLLIEKLCQALITAGYAQEEIVTKQPDSPQETFELAKAASQENIELVIAVGGDGTLNLIAGGIYAGGGQTKLGILPAGTVNNFARALNIPLASDQAIANIIHGRVSLVDICQVNDRYMMSSLVLGTIADLSADITSKDKRRFGRLAFLKNIFKGLTRNSRYHLRLTYHGKRHKVTTRFLLLTMTQSIAGMPILKADIKPDDGFLNGYYTEYFRPWKILTNLPQVTQEGFSKLFKITSFKVRRLVIESRREEENPEARIDGDPAGPLPLTLTVLPRAIPLIVPQPPDQDRHQ